MHCRNRLLKNVYKPVLAAPGTTQPPVNTGDPAPGRRSVGLVGRLQVGTSLAVLLVITSLVPMAATAQVDVDSQGYIGTQACAGCHENEYHLWLGSDHERAMQPATADTVLGNFNNTRFEHFGRETRFTKREGKFFVTTDNAEGKAQEFAIPYTFGVYPLQQYLLDVGDGHLQALTVAWDSRPVEEGGQRWFHLYPDEPVDHTDQLHWTGTYFNWNSRCAECHSTGLEKNYDPVSRSFATHWQEINVACEACHGPGQQHQSWAQNAKESGKADAAPQGHGLWPVSAVGQWLLSSEKDNTTAHKVMPKAAAGTAGKHGLSPGNLQLDTCGGCHSRRHIVGVEHQGESYHDVYQLALPLPPLYHADGQILDENFELGSFLQSKMHQEGVVCSNCHEPHSLKLRAPNNAVCAQCHRPDVFDVPSHHHHKVSGQGSFCVDCHMPETTYMVVDPRRDHSLRIPRPDLSVRYQTPNACNQCHDDQSAAWAAKAVSQWLKGAGKTQKPHFSDKLTLGLSGQPGSIAALTDLATSPQFPSIIQAAALSALGNRAGIQSMEALRAGLNSPDALVRRAAVAGFAAVPVAQRWQALRDLVDDPVKTVRMEVAQQLAGLAVDTLSDKEYEQVEQLYRDYQKALEAQADMLSAQQELADFYWAQGQLAKAEGAYRRALELDPQHLTTVLNLADLYRQTYRDEQGEVLLKELIARNPQAPAFHALGLLQVREQRMGAALKNLARAAQDAPDMPRYTYVYAVALNSTGQPEQAIAVLKSAVSRGIADADMLKALISMLLASQEWDEVEPYARQLQVLTPADPWVNELVRRLEQQPPH